MEFDFENSRDTASFHVSEDGVKWRRIGRELQLKYSLDLFIGCRIGIFYYSETEAGGSADFRNFNYYKL